MPPSYFPLRWESTGEQWWYASPIDWAAANGHYDLVRELIRLDNNLLMNLTSLRRIRRLETVWDDEAQFIDVAKCRSHIARNLFLECEIKKGKNSLICSGYGGWLLYTAASAGDLGFVQEILERNPLLVFGEGEYGVTDIFYAASRSKNSEVFRLLFVCAFSPRHSFGRGGELDECSSDVPTVFKWEMMNRAAHAAARGGNLEILRELLRGCSDVLVYRDAQGSTLLHAASGRGQVEVVKDLMGSFDIITSKDNQGNTALHVAAYRGHLGVVEALVHSSPSLTSSPNNAGDTFLHLAVAAFRAPSFHRLDRQIELMKQLVCGKITSLQEVINIRNNNGRTALHMAVIGNIHSNLVELLMSAPSIDLNICDNDNMTPLDLLNQHPQSASSEILIKRMTSAGGISNLQQDHMASSTIVSSRIKMQGPRSSPGTSFGISDAEIFFYSGVQNVSEASFGPSSCSSSSRSNFSHFENVNESGDKSSSSIYSASRHLKLLLGWPRRKEKKLDCNVADSCQVLVDNDQLEACKKLSDPKYNSTGLRQRFSKPPLLPNNKRTLSVRSSLPNPSTKKKFAAGLMNGVIQAMPNLAFSSPSPAGPCSRSHLSSSSKLMDKKKGIRKKGIPSDSEIGGPSYTKPYLDSGTPEMLLKSSSGSGGGLKNQYFCFGAPVLCVDDSITGQRQTNRVYKHSVLPMA